MMLLGIRLLEHVKTTFINFWRSTFQTLIRGEELEKLKISLQRLQQAMLLLLQLLQQQLHQPKQLQLNLHLLLQNQLQWLRKHQQRKNHQELKKELWSNTLTIEMQQSTSQPKRFKWLQSSNSMIVLNAKFPLLENFLRLNSSSAKDAISQSKK